MGCIYVNLPSGFLFWRLRIIFHREIAILGYLLEFHPTLLLSPFEEPIYTYLI